MKLKFLQAFLLTLVLLSSPFLSDAFYEEIQTYQIANKDKIKSKLDKIFAKYPNALESPDTIKKAGFTLLHRQPKSKIVVLKHPEIKGKVIKGYLQCDVDPTWTTPTWQRLLDRCIGAANIRKLIKKEKIKYFTVPDKQLYVVPSMEETVILIATDMKLTSNYDCHHAWKRRVTKDHLRELYLILSNGFASCYLQENIPYTKNDTFACVDTEYPQRTLDLTFPTHYFSEKMQAYWLQLISQQN